MTQITAYLTTQFHDSSHSSANDKSHFTIQFQTHLITQSQNTFDTLFSSYDAVLQY